MGSLLSMSGDSFFYKKLITVDSSQHEVGEGGCRTTVNQLSSGAFSGALRVLEVGSIRFAVEEANQELVKFLEGPSGYVSFSFLLEHQGATVINGVECPEVGVLMARSGCTPVVKTPGYFQVASVTMPSHLLLEYISPDFLVGDSMFERTNVMVCALNDSFKCALAAIQSLFELEWCLGKSFGEVEKVAKYVVAMICEGFSLGSGCIAPTDGQGRLLYRIADAVMDKSCGFAMDALAKKVGACQRKLQYSVDKAFGVSPYQYLRIMRLNAVRRELLREGQYGHIGPLAARWGFGHMGRFSKSYFDQFGEYPLQTVKGAAAGSQLQRWCS